MFVLKDLPYEEAKYAVENGDFSPHVTALPHAAVVMSQDWCPDWRAMERWLKAWTEHGQPHDKDIVVYLYIYNRAENFHDFLRLKEDEWKNPVIPYVRYYSNGQCVAESNYVTPEGFIKHICHENNLAR